MKKDVKTNAKTTIRNEANRKGFDYDKTSWEWAKMAANELAKEFNRIDERYDKKYKELEDFRKTIYKDKLDILKHDRDFTEKMILSTSDENKKAEWIKRYFDINIELGTMFDVAEARLDEKEVEIREEKKNDKTEKVILFVSKVALPFVLNVASAAFSYYMNNSTSVKTQVIDSQATTNYVIKK